MAELEIVLRMFPPLRGEYRWVCTIDEPWERLIGTSGPYWTGVSGSGSSPASALIDALAYLGRQSALAFQS